MDILTVTASNHRRPKLCNLRVRRGSVAQNDRQHKGVI